jgi:hypothetical protein
MCYKKSNPIKTAKTFLLEYLRVHNKDHHNFFPQM